MLASLACAASASDWAVGMERAVKSVDMGHGDGERRQPNDRRRAPREPLAEAKDLYQRLEHKRVALEIERRTSHRRVQDLVVVSARDRELDYT